MQNDLKEKINQLGSTIPVCSVVFVAKNIQIVFVKLRSIRRTPNPTYKLNHELIITGCVVDFANGIENVMFPSE